MSTSEQLIQAVRERIERGHTDEAIRSELLAAGYTDDVIDNLLSQIKAETATTNNQTPNLETAEVPKATKLIVDGWHFILKKPSLFFAVLSPLILIPVSGYFLITGPITSDLITIVVFVAIYFINLAVLYIINKRRTENVTIINGITWTLKNFFSLVWIGILTFFIIIGGIVLFLIPGIIAAIMISFASLAYINENKRGISAIMRSRNLLLGRVWAVLSQMFVIGILAFIFGLVIEITSAILPANLYIIGLVLSVVSNAVITLISLYVMAELYHWMSSTYTPPTEAKSARWKYITLAWFGVLFLYFLPFLLFLHEMLSFIGFWEHLRNSTK